MQQVNPPPTTLASHTALVCVLTANTQKKAAKESECLGSSPTQATQIKLLVSVCPAPSMATFWGMNQQTETLFPSLTLSPY